SPSRGSGGIGRGSGAFDSRLRGFLFFRCGLFFGHVRKGLGSRGGFLGFGDADGLARALAGAGVGAGALAADGEAATMPNATIAVDRLEALQVAGDFAT